jgi:hypothetical protein
MGRGRFFDHSPGNKLPGYFHESLRDNSPQKSDRRLLRLGAYRSGCPTDVDQAKLPFPLNQGG